VNSQPQLLEIVAALHSSSGFARSLHGRKQQANQDSDNRNNDQQLHKSEASSTGPPKYKSKIAQHKKPTCKRYENREQVLALPKKTA
jgi:hypothetical protein